jgi:hypothetical protein
MRTNAPGADCKSKLGLVTPGIQTTTSRQDRHLLNGDVDGRVVGCPAGPNIRYETVSALALPLEIVDASRVSVDGLGRDNPPVAAGQLRRNTMPRLSVVLRPQSLYTWPAVRSTPTMSPVI